LDVFEAIRTARAMRRLDPTREVPEADLERILEAATKGSSGGNRQPARWLVVRDPEQRRRVGEIYATAAKPVLDRFAELAERDPVARRNLASNRHLAAHMAEVPVLVIPCAAGERGRIEASVFPGVQNLILAARALGLGTTLTVIHLTEEQAVKDVMGIPDDVHTFAIIPVGYPLGHWGEAPRQPVSEVAYRDRWGEPF
jgi:nitroreductase